MIERFEVGKRYRLVGSNSAYSWNAYIGEGLMDGRVALCTDCNNPGRIYQMVEFDTVTGGKWSYLISENNCFEEVVEEYL